MLKFLETYNLPKLNQEEAIRLNRLIIASKIEGVIKKKKKLPAHNSPGLDSFTGEFYEICKEQITCILLKLFQNMQEEGRLPNSFYEASIILIPKPNKNTRKKTIGQYCQ